MNVSFPERSKGKHLVNLREPIWHTQDGDHIPLSQISNSHLQRIERWLRGGGATLPPNGMYGMWYPTIQGELTRRSLAVLPDHENALARDPEHIQQTLEQWIAQRLADDQILMDELTQENFERASRIAFDSKVID